MTMSALTLLFAAAWAGSGDAILADMDAAMTAGRDYRIHYTATTADPGDSPREMTFTVELEGEKRLVQFSSPGDVKGTRVLVLDRHQMYVYLPAYRKVRRVASHVTEQGFMGTTFSYDDMSTSQYAALFEAELVSETHEVWRLALTPRPDVDTPYGRMEAEVSKAGSLPTVFRYYSTSGEHLKTQTFESPVCRQEVCLPTLIRMTDHSRGGAWTTLEAAKWEVDTGLDETRFTVRELQRGE